MTTLAPIHIELWLERFEPIAERLQNAMKDVVAEAFDGRHRALDIEEKFDLGRTMASRFNRAMSADNPSDMALILPGRPSMMRFIERVQTLCKKQELVTELRKAYESFFNEVTRIASSNQELTAVLSAHDPRILREAAQRQRSARYQTDTNLMGCTAEVNSFVWFVTPGQENPKKLHVGRICSFLGLRRLGVMAPIVSNHIIHPEKETTGTLCQLDGQPITRESGGTVVRELCSPELPQTRDVVLSDRVCSIYHSDDLPQGQPVDIADATLAIDALQDIAQDESGTGFIANVVERPTKVFICDYLIHRDIFKGIDPVLKSYFVPPDVQRHTQPDDFWFNEFPIFDSLELIAPQRLLEPPNEAPKHAEVVRYGVETMGLNVKDFRAYRLVIRYPITSCFYYVYFSRKVEE